MIIKQKRIRNLSKLKVLETGSRFRVGVVDVEKRIKEMKKIGFTNELKIGETILPDIIGPATRRNAEGDYILLRDKPKEQHSRMIEWTYKQWAGRGETREVTESTSISYERFQRQFIHPTGIEFTIVSNGKSKNLVSPVFVMDETKRNEIISAVNVILEIFGECEIFDSTNNPILPPKVIRLNWELLPKGKFPWEKQKERLEPYFKRAIGTNRAVIEKRIETINEYSPDFTAIGTGGFGGYIVHGFEDLNMYILESVKVNNATYVLRNDWESISQLTKAEILNNDLHETRIVHNKNWYKNLNHLFDKNLS